MPVRVPLGPLFAVALILNTAVAAVLWIAVPKMGSFTSVWVYSQCVGLSITGLAVLIGHLPGVRHRSGVPALLAMLLPAAPLGYLIGHVLGAWLVGRPPTPTLGGSVATAAWLATVLATALAGLVLWGRARIRGEEAARAQAQRLATEAELRLLRAQLEPHMLFNTLANLRELVGEDPRAAQRMLDSLIVFLRGTLAATRSERTTLAEEFGQLRAYLELMAVRMGPRLSWQLHLPAELAAVALPPMLLQPLVENAIKHGLEPQVGPGAIDIAALREGSSVVVSVADTGRGGASQGAASGAGYGIHHVRERLRAAYAAQASLVLCPNAPRGTRAIVRLPMQWPPAP